jgi:hypothetical protein
VRLRGLIFVACIAWASLALADERSDFEKARVAYLKKDYVEADARFRAMLDPTTGTVKTPDLVHEAQFCWGATLYAKKDYTGAHAIWERVIRDTKGQYQPDPLTYPTDVINDFIDEKTRLNTAILQQQAQEAAEAAAQRKRDAEERARLQARVKELEKLTAEETVETKSSRLVAMLPFGIGQFQNRSTGLGWFFLLTESATVLGTVALFIPYRYNVDQYNAVQSNNAVFWTPHYRQTLANQYALVAQDLRTADLITIGVLGALMIGGIVEAQIDYKPSFEYKRPRKKAASIWPSFAPMTGGAQMGLQGRF